MTSGTCTLSMGHDARYGSCGGGLGEADGVSQAHSRRLGEVGGGGGDGEVSSGRCAKGLGLHAPPPPWAFIDAAVERHCTEMLSDAARGLVNARDIVLRGCICPPPLPFQDPVLRPSPKPAH